MRILLAGLLTLVLASAAGKQKFTGVVTDSMCARGDHSHMKMGATAGECAIACVLAHGALYVLTDGKEIYELSDQTTPEKLAGKKVVVEGTLDAKTGRIQVDSITLAK